ncbi:MAG: hypothetical protein M8319_02645 [Nitrosopumilus sp.]|nr:hypothetical protein [Nitrosopumilus sp.]
MTLLLPLSFPLSFGSVDDFTTNASLYHKDDQLNISGTVAYDPDNPFVTVQIFTPGKSNFAYFWTLPANSDGSFSHSLIVGGPTWTSDGNYLIVVTSHDGEKLEKSIEYNESPPTISVNQSPNTTPAPSQPSTQKSTQIIPSWIKTNAGWWAEGEISDSVFITGIEFMLENNIIIIPNISSENISGNEIPNWVRNNANWWSQDLISESEFVNSLKFLIQTGIITIN